jgi:hypothetical protein
MKNIKKIIIGIIVLVLIIVLVVFFYRSRPTQWQKTLDAVSNNFATSTINTIQDNQESTSTSIAPIIEAPVIDFNDPKILADARSIPKDLSVMHIRKVFNEYVSGVQGNLDYDAVLDTTEEYRKESIAQFDKSLYKSRFIVNDVNSAPMGGEVYDIIFIDYPQQVYSAWIYMQGSEDNIGPSFRTFQINDAYPANYGEELLRLNPSLKTNTTLSI